MAPIYIVLLVVIIIWLGIFGYLFYLHKKINTLSQLMKMIKDNKNILNQSKGKG